MINGYSNIEDLIAKHLAGETNADENAMLTSWLSESEANKKYFETLKKIFFESASLKNNINVDTDAAWNKLQSEIRNPGHTEQSRSAEIRNLGHTERSRSAQTSNFKLLYRIAAIFVLVVLTATTYFFLTKENIQTINIASTNETKTILLPDSSSVFMNKNTTLAYTFSKDKRELILTGEAFFDVKHDENKPFIIHAKDLKIEDIGTSFNVKAIKNSDSVQVIVESGEVELTAELNPDYNLNYRLTPGQQAVYNKKAKQITKTAVKDTNAMAYRTKIFVFENASLQAVVQKLTEVYGVEISISEKIKSCHITATFKNEKIDAIMDVIASTLNLKLTKNENKYILEGDGCEE